MTRKKTSSKNKISAQSVRITEKEGERSRIPQANVLDLRSVVAKKEVEQQRELERKKAEQLFGLAEDSTPLFQSWFGLSAKRVKRIKKKRHRTAPQLDQLMAAEQKQEEQLAVQHAPEEMLSGMEQVKDTSLIRTAPTAEEVAFWSEVEAEEKAAQASRKHRPTKQKRHFFRRTVQKREKPVRAPRDRSRGDGAFWNRPVRDAELEKAKKVALPGFGVNFAQVGKPLLIFAAIAFVVILPPSVYGMINGTGNLEAIVTQTAEEAFVHLQEAGGLVQEFNFDAAQTEFEEAVRSFAAAQQEIDRLNGVVVAVAKYVPGKGKQFHTGQLLLQAGSELALAGEQATKALTVLEGTDIASVANDEDNGITPVLVVIHSALVPTQAHVSTANEYLQQISLDDIPSDKKDLVQTVQNALPIIDKEMLKAVTTTEALLQLLGHESSKRYLVLFQNNHEMRPTGGFIGSLALIDIDRGVVTGLDVPGGGVYDVAGQLDERVVSPGPLHLVNPHWNIQDANWFPHFPTSAEKVLWFYENSGGPTVDGVITLVPRVIEQLLEVSGPIDLTEEFGVVIDKNNFYDEVQVRAEEKFDVTTESKRIIGAMTPLLFNQLFTAAGEPESLLGLLATIQNSLDNKDMLLYMRDAELQHTFSRRDWTGELRTADRDYLAVVHTNIGGGKTDSAMEEVVTHNAAIQEDGRIIDTVTIARVHKGDSAKPFENVNNVDYVRFYVPKGSTLLSATGFETPQLNLFQQPQAGYTQDKDLSLVSGDVVVHERTGVSENAEFEKTVFGGWTQTAVGESSVVTIEYELPFRVDVESLWQQSDRYSLLVQKQPGAFDHFFISTVDIPQTIKATRWYPPGYDGSTQMVLRADYFAGMVIEQAR